MNPKRARSLLTFVVWPAGGALLGSLGYIHGALAFLIFPWAFLVEHWVSRLRCQRGGARVEGTRFLAWENVWTPDECPKCGVRYGR